MLVSEEELEARRRELEARGGYPIPPSQTPWQEIQRAAVGQLDTGRRVGRRGQVSAPRADRGRTAAQSLRCTPAPYAEVPGHSSVRSRDQLGEGLLWSARENAVYWVDILAPALHRLSLADESVVSWAMPEKIGWVIERRDRPGFIAGMQSGFCELTLDPVVSAVHWWIRSRTTRTTA